MGSRRPRLSACVALALLWLLAERAGAQESTAAMRARAIDLAYNLDHAEAVKLLERAIAADPNDPASHRALANVLWLNILFQRGAVTVDHYLGSFSRSSVDLKKPPAELDAQFREHVGKAIQLAEARVSARPSDVQAHYDLGSAVGLNASYVATVEGRMLAGFRGARRAYDEHERVLQLDPSRKDAGLVVGTYRYIVSTLSLPMRMMAYVAGFGGGRERGIALLEDAAKMTGDTRSDALFALVLVYNREQRYDDALNALQELRRLHPRNRLVLLEAGATALRARRARQADQMLTEGLAMFAADTRPKFAGEEQLWCYKRGAARAAAGDAGQAVQDLQVAAAAPAADWVQGRARVELGQLALKRGDRQGASAEAERARGLCETGHDPVCVEDAQRLMRDARGR